MSENWVNCQLVPLQKWQKGGEKEREGLDLWHDKSKPPKKSHQEEARDKVNS